MPYGLGPNKKVVSVLKRGCCVIAHLPQLFSLEGPLFGDGAGEAGHPGLMQGSYLDLASQAVLFTPLAPSAAFSKRKLSMRLHLPSDFLLPPEAGMSWECHGRM